MQDQVPDLQAARPPWQELKPPVDNQLTVIEVQQFRTPELSGLDGYGANISSGSNSPAVNFIRT